jgi:hypothetical protein
MDTGRVRNGLGRPNHLELQINKADLQKKVQFMHNEHIFSNTDEMHALNLQSQAKPAVSMNSPLNIPHIQNSAAKANSKLEQLVRSPPGHFARIALIKDPVSRHCL